MTPMAQGKADEAKALMVHHLSSACPGADYREIETIVDLIIDAAVEEACYQMSKPDDDDREKIQEGDYRYFSPITDESSP